MRIYIFLLLSLCIPSWSLSAQTLDELIDNALQFAEQQLENTVEELNYNYSIFPHYTQPNGDPNGKWRTSSTPSWHSGYFVGSLWSMYEYTGEEQFKTWAENWTSGVESGKNTTGNSNHGHIIMPSFGNGFRVTGNEHYKNVIFEAANHLYSTRYSQVVGCFNAQTGHPMGWIFPVIIDHIPGSMELLFWAARNADDQVLFDAAYSNSLKVLENHIRDDGSTYHLIEYNPETGEIDSMYIHQGDRSLNPAVEKSVWARGQAWGLVGFPVVYRETGEQKFLEATIKIADWFIDHLPEDKVPYYDFVTDDVEPKKEASAAAIAAYGCLSPS